MSRILKVGHPYSARRQWPECAQYNYRGGEHELALFFRSPSPGEVAAVGSEEAELALYVDQPVVLLLYRFGADGGGIPWSDAPYSWHAVPSAERTLPGADEAQAALRVLLVDAGTGLVRAMRLALLADGFTGALHAAIRHQAERTAKDDFDAKLAQLYRRHPTCDEMARLASHVTTLSAKPTDRAEA